MGLRTTQALAGVSAAFLGVGIGASSEAQSMTPSQTISSSDTPLTIPASGSSGTITSTIDVTGFNNSIEDVDVALDINHTWFSDLDVTVESPNGTIVELFTDILGAADPNGTYTLDDEASTNITASGAAPGTYTPENGMLSDFDGEDPNGTWILTIVDDAGGDIGTLNGWSLMIQAAQNLLNADVLKSSIAAMARLSTSMAANNARNGVASSFVSRDAIPSFSLGSGERAVVSTQNGKLVGNVHTWLEFSGFIAKQDSNRKISGSGIQFGADFGLSPNWVLGVSVGNDELHARSPGASIDGEFTFAQPYVGYQRGDWSGELSLLYGEADYTQTSAGGVGTADSEVWSVNLSIARDIALSETVRVTPIGSVHYGEEKITGKTGTLAGVGSSTVDFSELSLGARFTHQTVEGMSYIGFHTDYVASNAPTALAGQGFDPEGLSARIELGTGFPISSNGNVQIGAEAGGIGSDLAEYSGQVKISFEF